MRISDWSSDVCSSDLDRQIARADRLGADCAPQSQDDIAAMVAGEVDAFGKGGQDARRLDHNVGAVCAAQIVYLPSAVFGAVLERNRRGGTARFGDVEPVGLDVDGATLTCPYWHTSV